METEKQPSNSPSDADLARLVTQLAEELKRRGWTLATAESCTGGWIAKCCTDLPGSSDWFSGAFVTYSDQAKQDMLHVFARTLATHGAVSRSVVDQMAEAARLGAGASLSVAVSGIAGPDGGTPEKPVGTVWVAWSFPRGISASRQCHFSGDRDAVRRQTVAFAISGILERLPAAE